MDENPPHVSSEVSETSWLSKTEMSHQVAPSLWKKIEIQTLDKAHPQVQAPLPEIPKKEQEKQMLDSMEGTILQTYCICKLAEISQKIPTSLPETQRRQEESVSSQIQETLWQACYYLLFLALEKV
jgi:hypothetical protein